jgi:hypothetical protein
MVLISTSSEPSVYGLGGSGGIPTRTNVVLTYPMAASASVSRGDWVKLSSTVTGVIVKCTDTADKPLGVAFTDVDNSSGAASAKYCPILRKGFAYVSAGISSSGAVIGKLINFDDLLYLSATASYTPYEGQILTSTNGGTCVARAMDSNVIAPSTTPLFVKMRVYLDRLTSSSMLVG